MLNLIIRSFFILSLTWIQVGYTQTCMDSSGARIPCPDGQDPTLGSGLVGQDPSKDPGLVGQDPSKDPSLVGQDPSKDPGVVGQDPYKQTASPNTAKQFGDVKKMSDGVAAFEKRPGGPVEGGLPSFPQIPFQNETGKTLEETGAVKFLGTSLFLNCQRQTSKPWGEMVSTYGAKTTDDMWNESWWSLAKSIEQKYEEFKLTPSEAKALDSPEKANESGDFSDPFQEDGGGLGSMMGGYGGGQTGDHQQDELGQKFSTGNPLRDARSKLLAAKAFIRKGIARGKGKSLTLKKCSALVPSTSKMDYNSTEDTVAIVPKTSMDRKVACRSRGAETQDYPSCRKLVKLWDAFFAGKKLLETTQNVKYQTDARERQEHLSLDMASTNPDPLLPLKMQKAGVDDQAAVAFQNSFFLTAQYGLMQSRYNDFPSRPDLVKTCQSAYQKVEEDPNLKTYNEWFKNLVSGFDPYAKKLKMDNFMDAFKKEKEIVPSCPVNPMMGMGSMGYGGGYGSSYGSFGGGMGGMSDFGGAMGMSTDGDDEGAIGAVRYSNCDAIFVQNAQQDMATTPPMPQGGGLSSGYGGGYAGYGGGTMDSYGGYGGGMDMGMGGSYGGGAMGYGMSNTISDGEMMSGIIGGDSGEPCVDVMNSGAQLILNAQSRQNLKGVLVQTGIEAATNLMKGMMLRQQSAKIQALIDGAPVPDPALDKLTQQEEDLIASVCELAPQEPICADFSNRTNGFNSQNMDLTPPDAATSVARVKANEQSTDAITEEAPVTSETDIGEAGYVEDAENFGGDTAGTSPAVTYSKAEGSGGGEIATDAKLGEVIPGEEKAAATEEETATPDTAYTGGSEARAYTGPGFRADQYKGGQPEGLDKIAGEYGSMGFREPASNEGISPKEAGGLFKIISNRYEAISKDRLMPVKSEVSR